MNKVIIFFILLKLALVTSVYAQEVITLEEGFKSSCSILKDKDLIINDKICDFDIAVSFITIDRVVSDKGYSYIEVTGAPELLEKVTISMDKERIQITEDEFQLEERTVVDGSHPFFSSGFSSGLEFQAARISGKRIIMNGHMLLSTGQYFKIPNIVIYLSPDCLNAYGRSRNGKSVC